MTQATTMTSRDWLYLLILSLLWGGSFFFAEVAVPYVPPLTIVFVRVGLAALILHAVMRLSGQVFPTDKASLLAFVGMGLLNNVIPFSLLVWGQTQIASGLASILNATMPLFTVLVAHLLTRDEKATPHRLLGVMIGFSGVVMMIGMDFSGSTDNLWAQLACLAAPLSYAFASIFGRRFATMGISPMATATGQVTASSLILLPMVMIVDTPWALPLPDTNVILSLIALAALSTALAYILYFRILSSAGATNISLVTFLVPVSAILLGTLLLNEVLKMEHIIGMALIGVGMAAIDGRMFAKLKPS